MSCLCGDPQCPSCGLAQGTYEGSEPHRVSAPISEYEYYRRVQKLQEELARARDDADMARACANEFKRQRDELSARVRDNSVIKYASKAQAKRVALNSPDTFIRDYFDLADECRELRDRCRELENGRGE